MRQLGDHAIVLGAGVAGLLAARVLTDCYEQVRSSSATRCLVTSPRGAECRRVGTPT